MKKKIIRIFVVLVLLAAGVGTGYYLYGKMHDPKGEAVALLKQLPDKLNKNLSEEVLGTKELMTNCESKGMDLRFVLSDLQGAKLPKEVTPQMYGGINNLSLTVDAQSDQTKKRVDISIKNDLGKMSGTVYTEGDKMQLQLPELLSDKTILVWNNMKENLEQEETTNFKKSFAKFMEEECTALLKSATCERLEDQRDSEEQSYELTISTDAVVDFVEEFKDFMDGHEEIVKYINENQLFGINDVLQVLQNKTDEIAASGTEYQLKVVGKEEALVAVFFEDVSLGKLDLTFDESNPKYTRAINYENSKLMTKFALTIEEKKDDQYSATQTLEMRVKGKGGKIRCQEIINPTDNSLNVIGSINNMINFSGTGFVKDLQKGKSINYAFDEFAFSAGGKDLLSGSLECGISTLEGKLEPLKGVELSNDKISEMILSSLKNNMMSKFSEMGVINLPKKEEKKSNKKKEGKKKK